MIFFAIKRPNNGAYAGYIYGTGTGFFTYNFFTGLRENDNKFHIFNGQLGVDALAIQENNNFIGIALQPLTPN